MKTINVNLGKRSYKIVVGYNIMASLSKFIAKLNIGQDAFVITNQFIKNKYSGLLEKSLKKSKLNVIFKTIPDTEKSKSIKTLALVINRLAKFDKSKRVFIIAFGGGVIGDLSGFIASVYKRGIAYIQLPTTLLGQVDSSIGGKTGIDLAEGKNLAGAIYQPRLVFSDVKFLNTLDQRQIRAGLAEVIKYAIIKDKILFAYLEKNYKNILKLNSKDTEYIVNRCSLIKACVVGRDEREAKGLRTVLNFGHTIGHAIEAAACYKSYNHGEAVALGMLAACDMSCALGLISRDTYSSVERLIKFVGLPTKIKGLSKEKIINAHYHDKKFIGLRNRFVLIQGIGKTKIVENIPLKVIKDALAKRLSGFGKLDHGARGI
jgi:3-dehydroquinate synthase